MDSGYPNWPGYLAPYRGAKYHLQEYREGPMPRGKKELFNYSYSSFRNVIERFWSFEDEVEDIVRFAELSNGKAKPNSYGLHGRS